MNMCKNLWKEQLTALVIIKRAIANLEYLSSKMGLKKKTIK